MPATIYVARHGQNVDNLNGVLNGRRDLPLTSLGKQQARDLATGILKLGISFDAIYSSPLVRALETARVVSHSLNDDIKPIILEDLTERDMGSMSGVPIDQIESRCANSLFRTDTITYFLSADGAEIFPDVLLRAHHILSIVRQKHANGNILLVCHGDIGKMIYAAANNQTWHDALAHFHFGNGELIEINGKGRVHVISLPQFNT